MASVCGKHQARLGVFYLENLILKEASKLFYVSLETFKQELYMLRLHQAQTKNHEIIQRKIIRCIRCIISVTSNIALT